MHSSRMRTARLLAVSPSMDCSGGSASVLAGIHPLGVGLETPTPRCGLGDLPPRCGPGDPPGCGPGDPPRCGPGDPPECGPGNPPGVGLQTPPQVWVWRTPRDQTPQPPPGCGPRDPPGDLQGMLGYHPPDTCNACWDTNPPP